MVRVVRVLSVKLGTMPTSIQLRYRYKIREGLPITYRQVRMGADARWRVIGPWVEGLVDACGGPFPFISRR